MLKILHNVSKEGRRQILEILLRKRSRSEVASMLGVTPAAITKYLKGNTHPSDEVLRRCVDFADEEERFEIKRIILDDITSSLKEFLGEEGEEELSIILKNLKDRSLKLKA
ncbi:helix-turn-helix domain-containing protein [Sulfodiicoccus acidiphilus]|uniref:helix-turn-helix domain-containing protein n=1 Tax=Sulfodiicoccus acidiphilus TaxID=1670455 RepID=UPI001E628130|nr:helix-turn-helix transcriptional regulator [Sulfodiicoccus acidiphilus]